jgi:opacity protein-like surface antigen
MKAVVVSFLAAVAAVPLAAQAQQGRQPGWEFGADVIYQDSSKVTFDGGSKIDFQDDWGLDLAFAYRFNERLELTFGLDWQEVSYDADFVSALDPTRGFRVNGDMEAFTPKVGLNFNFMPGPITPFVTGSVGWTFVDTNIPNGRVQVGCWWDPWWGQICTPYQSTKSIDDFAYDLGVGLRWDLNGGFTLRAAYEKHWFDYGKASSTPDFDQIKVGLFFRY